MRRIYEKTKICRYDPVSGAGSSNVVSSPTSNSVGRNVVFICRNSILPIRHFLVIWLNTAYGFCTPHASYDIDQGIITSILQSEEWILVEYV